MDEAAFTAAFCDFIRACVPNFEAAAVLACMMRQPEQPWSAGEIVSTLKSSVSITSAETERCLELFDARGLLERDANRLARLRPHGYLQDAHLRTLADAYREKPVTLVQLIYALRDDKIRSFSDAFRLRED